MGIISLFPTLAPELLHNDNSVPTPVDSGIGLIHSVFHLLCRWKYQCNAV